MSFFCIHISQCLATCLKRGGIFKREFVANLLPSWLVKKIENRIIVSGYGQEFGVLFFLTHGVVTGFKQRLKMNDFATFDMLPFMSYNTNGISGSLTFHESKLHYYYYYYYT